MILRVTADNFCIGVSRPRLSRSQRHRLAAVRRRRGIASGRWSPGPYSHLNRLRVAAFGDHVCRLYVVPLARPIG